MSDHHQEARAIVARYAPGEFGLTNHLTRRFEEIETAAKAEAEATLQQIRQLVEKLSEMRDTSEREYRWGLANGAQHGRDVAARKAEACTLNVVLGELAALLPASTTGETP